MGSLVAKFGGKLLGAFRGNTIQASSLTTGAVGNGLVTIVESIESSVGTVGKESVQIVSATGKTMEALNSSALNTATTKGRMSQDDINKSNAHIQYAKDKQVDLKQKQLEIAEYAKLSKEMIKTSGAALKAQTEVATEQAKFAGTHAEAVGKLTGEVGTAIGKVGRLTGRDNLRRAFASVA